MADGMAIEKSMKPGMNPPKRNNNYVSSWCSAKKLSFQTMNRNGKWLKLRLIWDYFIGIYRFHSLEPFRSSVLIMLNRALGKWRPLKLHPVIGHSIYNLWLENTSEGARITKLPRCSNELSVGLVNALKTPAVFSTYVNVLTGLTRLPWLGKHCVMVTGVRRNGGYSCEYVDGVNLKELREKLFSGDPLPGGERQKLLNAIQALIEDLNEYNRRNGRIIGDWQLNNLMFARDRGVIVNVDAEGFYTFGDGKSQWSLQQFEANLRALGELIRLVDSESTEDCKTADLFTVRDKVHGSGKRDSANLVADGHSLELNSRRFRVQSECSARLARVSIDSSCGCRSCVSRNFVLKYLEQVPFDFRDKVVLDLGCNMGDMLHALANTIRKGYGFDVNPSCVNAAHLTKDLCNISNLEFFTFDPEEQNLALLKCFLLRQSVDISFLFSTRNWSEQWPGILEQAAKLSPAMLFEAEILQQQSNRVNLLRKYYEKIELVAEVLDENCGSSSPTRRQLYLCSESKRCAERKHLVAEVTGRGGLVPA